MNKLRQAHVALQGDLNALGYRRWSSRWISTHGVSTPPIYALEHAWRYDHPREAIYAPLLLKQLSDRKPADSVVTTDVGQHQMWIGPAHDLHPPGELHHLGAA